MNIKALLIGESPVVLWSLSSRERLQRQLKSLAIALAEDTPGAKHVAPEESRYLLVRCDFLFETRTFQALLQKEEFLLLSDDHTEVAAAIVGTAQAENMARLMEQQFADRQSDVPQVSTAGEGSSEQISKSLASGDRSALSVYDKKLRRATPPLLEQLTSERIRELEDELYGNAYKGVTDLVTKWVWPRPAKYLVNFCAKRDISPNQVTSVGLLLVILSGFFFYRGYFAFGLVAGWIMTLLDTVDGKLARVRVQSSEAGNLFDHGIDLIHPPFWYLLWGMGLAHLGYSVPITLAGSLIFIGYIGGRLAELAFQQICGGSIFVWRPFDSWFRLITARRNPCLIILTATLFAPLAGFWMVVGWTLLTTIILWIRVVQGCIVRSQTGQKLPSWLEEPDASDRYPRDYPVFSRTLGAYGS